MGIDVTKRNTGVTFSPEGTAEITVWSPEAASVELILHENKPLSLNRSEYGYWKLTTNEIRPGDEYWLSVNGGEEYPDPASLSQRKGVHGPSTAVDLHQFEWTDQQWDNIALDEYIIYELHTGTFSSEHNFAGVQTKLDHLVELGINAIEIMPVSQFPSSRNWGYDGVFPSAVQDSYGGAHALQSLVNACHQRGLAVILDVVYNHIGPEGNYFPKFGPYFTSKYFTPWGEALNFDDAWCNGPRDYFIDNALMWFRDFHIDALRMDAVHAIRDFSPKHLIKDIREHANRLTEATGKQYYLITELDLNDPKFINPFDQGGYGASAQWVDEFHHALRVAGGQPREGYYSDFNGIADLAKSYNDAYVYDGQFSEHRKKFFGAKTDNAGSQFIVFSQNHDQTGNRMLGERTSTLVSYEMQKLMAGAVLVSPFLPMLFMGEEWGEPNPFLFFVSHTDKELTSLVKKGRLAEFAYFNWKGHPPDPSLESTFNASMLQWSLTSTEPHGTLLRYYQQLIALRKSQPALKRPDRASSRATADEEKQLIILERWAAQQRVICFMNFSATAQQAPVYHSLARKLFDSASTEWRGPRDAPAQANDSILIQPESILIYEQA